MSLKEKIETVLYVTRKALKLKEIAEILGADEIDVESEMLDLIMDYSSRDGALEIDDENGYILQPKQEHMDIVEKLCPLEISKAVQKTLTVIALKQPLRLSALKELRGANAYDHVNELVQFGLVSKTKDKNGRSYNLRTTQKFVEYFKLKGDFKNLVKFIDIEGQAKD